jgi:hypothetical protein
MSAAEVEAVGWDWKGMVALACFTYSGGIEKRKHLLAMGD